MTHTPHEIHEEFPDDAEAIHALKTGNAHFARLMDQYHEVNREVHRIEAEIEATTDETLNELRRKRLFLKDEIAGMIAAHKRAVA